MKHTVSEFANYSLSDIEKKYIEVSPLLSINTVPLDDTLDIKGKQTESNSPLEGLITFDIIFDAFVPSSSQAHSRNLRLYAKIGLSEQGKVPNE